MGNSPTCERTFDTPEPINWNPRKFTNQEKQDLHNLNESLQTFNECQRNTQVSDNPFDYFAEHCSGKLYKVVSMALGPPSNEQILDKTVQPNEKNCKALYKFADKCDGDAHANPQFVESFENLERVIDCLDKGMQGGEKFIFECDENISVLSTSLSKTGALYYSALNSK